MKKIYIKKTSGITLIALVITIIVLLIIAGITINMVLNGGILEKAQTATKQYTIAQIKEEIENELVDIQATILQQEKRMATLDDVEANFIAKGYPTKREVATAEQKETKVSSLEVIKIADGTNDVLKVGYKGYIATINTALKVIKVEEGELATSKTIGSYEVKSEEGENLTILITIENEDGLESIIYPDSPEDAIVFTDKRTITTKDITLQAEQEYEIKIKAVGEEEQSYKIIPTTKPIIKITRTDVSEEMVDNVTVEKITKTVEIEYSSNNQYKNYYSINNGEIWQEYTKAIQLSENCTIKAKSIINGGNGIEKQTETEKEIYIIDKLIPTMISNTTNENNEEMAKITADSYYSSEYMPYFAFDKDNVSAWCSEANAKYPHSLYYEFTDGKVRSIKKVEFVTIFDSWHNEYEVQVFGTNDDITWDEITNKITIPLNYGEQSIVTDSINKNAYKKFKFTCYGYAYSTLKDVAIWEVQLYGYSI